MSQGSIDAQDAAFRYLMNVQELRGHTLPKDTVAERVEGLFQELCVELAPTLSLEIGAHEAGFSARLKRQSPGTRCVAFEANPYVYEKFAARHAESGVEYLHMAVSETNGTVELGIPRHFQNARGRRFTKTRTNRMASLSSHRYAEETELVSVPSMRGDDFVQVAQDDVVVAWIDVEGASGAVLESTARALSHASLVYIEVENESVWDNQWLDLDVARFLATCGLVPLLRDVQRPHQYNVVFANAEIAARADVAARCESVFEAADS